MKKYLMIPFSCISALTTGSVVLIGFLVLVSGTAFSGVNFFVPIHTVIILFLVNITNFILILVGIFI